jgi:hypothetical protein
LDSFAQKRSILENFARTKNISINVRFNLIEIPKQFKIEAAKYKLLFEFTSAWNNHFFAGRCRRWRAPAGSTCCSWSAAFSLTGAAAGGASTPTSGTGHHSA